MRIAKPWTGPDGNIYESFDKMCEQYKVNPRTAKRRLNSGKSLAEALYFKGVVDFNGTTYRSFENMCISYGKTSEYVNRYLKKGYSLKEILLTEKGKLPKSGYEDPFGKKHASFREMCTAYGKNYRTVYRDLKKGISLETALTR